MIDIEAIVKEFSDNFVAAVVYQDQGKLKQSFLSPNTIATILSAVEKDPMGSVLLLSMGGNYVVSYLQGVLEDPKPIPSAIVAFNCCVLEVVASGYFIASTELKSLLGMDSYSTQFFKGDPQPAKPSSPNYMPEGFTPKGDDPFANLDFKMDWNPDLKD